jgi:hypothetical protein
LLFLLGWSAVWVWQIPALLSDARLALDSEGWATAPGVVTDSFVRTGRRGGRRRGRGSRTAVVTYDYRVGETTFRGSRVAFFRMMQDADETKDRYYRGRRVVVYFDRANPAESVLEPGFHPGHFAAESGAILLMSAVGLGAAAFSARVLVRRVRH